MGIVEKTLGSGLTPKKKQIELVKAIEDGTIKIKDVVKKYHEANTSDRGLFMEVLESVSSRDPSKLRPHLEFVIKQIGESAPRVKWESSRIVANLAKDFAVECEKAIAPLKNNMNHDGTVVRWSAAKALCEIAKYSDGKRKALYRQILAWEAEETNRGVKSIFTKTLKKISKQVGG